MFLEELLHQLTLIAERSKLPHSDKKTLHLDADTLLLAFINNEDVTRLFDSIDIGYL